MIKRDFIRKQMLVGTENLIIQIFRHQDIRRELWTATENPLKEGVADSDYVQFIIRQHPDYKAMIKEFTTFTGFLKNESFVLEWY